jgi:hypothetical protein
MKDKTCCRCGVIHFGKGLYCSKCFYLFHKNLVKFTELLTKEYGKLSLGNKYHHEHHTKDFVRAFNGQNEKEFFKEFKKIKKEGNDA